MSNLEAIRNLKKRAQEIAASLHLKVNGFVLIPGDEDSDPDLINIAFQLTPEAVESMDETEKRVTDAAFNDLFAAEFGDSFEFEDDETQNSLAAEEDKYKQAVADLKAMMEEDE